MLTAPTKPKFQVCQSCGMNWMVASRADRPPRKLKKAVSCGVGFEEVAVGRVGTGGDAGEEVEEARRRRE